MSTSEHAATADPADVLRELFARIDTARWAEVGALYAEDVVVRHPTRGDGPETSEGREAVERFFGDLASTVTGLRVEDLRVWATSDPEVAVAELRFDGHGARGGFAMPALFLARVRDGRIVESHDYLGTPRPR